VNEILVKEWFRVGGTDPEARNHTGSRRTEPDVADFRRSSPSSLVGCSSWCSCQRIQDEFAMGGLPRQRTGGALSRRRITLLTPASGELVTSSARRSWQRDRQRAIAKLGGVRAWRRASEDSPSFRCADYRAGGSGGGRVRVHSDRQRPTASPLRAVLRCRHREGAWDYRAALSSGPWSGLAGSRAAFHPAGPDVLLHEYPGSAPSRARVPCW
jgi:hypothetical protein